MARKRTRRKQRPKLGASEYFRRRRTKLAAIGNRHGEDVVVVGRAP